MTVNVIPINQPPNGISATVTTREDISYVFASGDFGFSDPGNIPANNFLAVKVSSLPLAGTLADNGTNVTQGQFVSATDIAARRFTFTPAPNSSGSNYANFAFQVQDDGGTANGGSDTDPSPRTMTVNVSSVNDAPTGTSKTVMAVRKYSLHLWRRRFRVQRSE